MIAKEEIEVSPFKMPDSFKDLIAWQKAMALAKAVYKITAQLPSNEQYGFSPQMRRAAVSIPSNIAEGKGRHTQKDFQHFLMQSRGSLNELETELILAAELDLLKQSDTKLLLQQIEELGRILNGLIQSLVRAAGA